MENITLIALSRQTVLQREMQVVANNVANINTTGFKADGAVFGEFLSPIARAEDFAPADQKLSFVVDRASWRDTRQGAIQQTGGPLDVAIEGDGMLVVQAQNGERYTRNGSFQINNLGELVTSTGERVLGDNGPIILQRTDRDIVITKSGTINVREGESLNSDTPRGKLRVVRFENLQALQKEGSSTYSAPAGVTPEPVTNPNIVQGAIEKSNVNAMLEMTRMIEVSRAYTEVANILAQQSELKKTALQQLADVPV
jgi:flagellar basal-body rod protein FlgF